MKTILAISTAIAASSVTYANDNYDEVIVTANRIEQPLSTTLPTATVITSSDIRRLQPSDLPSLLGRVSGVSFRDSGGRGSSSGIFIRGTSSSQVIVLIDGVRSASATTGATALENIPIETIERIEVVKGPLSSLYGADALGGVIQVFTKRGTNDGLEGTVSVGVGSNKLKEQTVSISGGNDKHQFYASFSSEDTDGIDRTDRDIDGNQDRDGFDEKSGNLSASFTLSDDLKARVSYLKSEGETEFDNVFGVDSGRFSENELESIATDWVYTPSELVRLSLNLGYLSDHSITPVFDSDIQTRRRSVNLQGDFKVASNHQLSFGVDYYDDSVKTLANFDETDRDNQGVFAQWQAGFGDINLVSSLRYDDNQAYGTDTNGTLALAYRISDSIELVTSVGTAFKAPTFNDLYFPNFGNIDVLPEESESLEVSLRGSHSDYEWRLSAYRTEVENLIGFDFSTFTAGNIANATLEGVELEVGRTFGTWSFSGNLDYLEARDDDSNEFLDDRAVWSGNLEFGKTFQAVFVGVDISAEHGRHDRGGEELPNHELLGASVVYDINENFKISGRINNLLDKDYTLNLASSSVAYETEGRTYKVSASYRFK